MKTLTLALCMAAFAAAQAPAQVPAQAPAQTPGQAQAARPTVGSMYLPNVPLPEVIDQLAKQLGITYVLDPRVKGTVFINTYGETRNLDTRNLLDMLLRMNGAAMVQDGDVYRIVPMADAPRHSLRAETAGKNITEDEQLMLNMVFLKYVTVDELIKVLQPFIGENATTYPYAPANLLFILDSRRNMNRIMDIVAMFDADTFAASRVRLFDVVNTRPSDLQKDLENVLKGISLDNGKSTVRFLPVDRIGVLIAIAPNPGAFETVETWIKKLDIPIVASAGSSVDNYVYRVRYARADCLSMALTMLFGYGGLYGSPVSAQGYGGGYGTPYASQGGYGYPAMGQFYGGMGGGYGSGGGYGGAYGAVGGGASGGYGSANSFSSQFGGSAGCSGGTGMGGMGGGMGMGGMGMGGMAYGGGMGYGGYGYPAFGGYSAQAPAGSGPMGSAPAAAAPNSAAAQAAPVETPPRIVANPFDNSLIIQADAAKYQSILKVLKDLDVPPRQILLEAKIYSVDMTGAFASGVTAAFQARSSTDKSPLVSLSQGSALLSAGALVGQTKELLGYLSLQENQTHAHVVSQPSLIATDSIPASINVGTQVPVLTTQSASPIQVSGTNSINQTISGVNTGVTLQVNARVNPSGVVTLVVNQEISKPTANASGNSLTPSFDQQVVQTQITMQDGDTIAIGGIIAENGTNTTQGIPLLHRIPYIGAAFGSKSYTTSRSELILFMTPHVIYDTNDLLEASDELKARVKKLKRYIKE